MKIDQYYLECLSQASYLIADEEHGVAAVVDPRRDVEVYLRDATAAGLRIQYIIETHFHADFLSGHLELAAATGAEIIFGKAASPDYPARLVSDGERIRMGSVELEFLATPGHTPESISVVVRDMSSAEGDERPEPAAVLTGDTLFIGDVGRPDLLASVGVTAEELGASLYESLHTKLMTLPDQTLVYPAHGAGLAFSKTLSTETVSTIGEQKRTNYALAPMTAEQFIDVVTDGQPSAPAYFSHAVATNKGGHELVDAAPLDRVDLAAAAALAIDGAVLLDVRDSTMFAAGHVAGSVNVGLDGRFAEYVGMIIEPDDRVVLVASTEAEVAEARLRMRRIGFDEVVAAVADVESKLTAEPDRAERASRVRAVVLDERRRELSELVVLDVRNAGERSLGAIPDSVHIPLAELTRRVDELDLSRPIVVHCAGGYRSSVAASWLRTRGASDVSDLMGGIAAWDSRPLGADQQSIPAHLDVVALDELLEADTDLRLLDVRTPAEFGTAHIPGAYNVPLDTLAEHAHELQRHLEMPVVVICRTGNRARQAEQRLAAAGMANVHVLHGGMEAWDDGRRDVRRGSEKWALERQVRLVAGSIVLGGILASLRWPKARFVSGAVGTGLTFAALTDTCAMGMALAKLPYNRDDSCDVDRIVAQLTSSSGSGAVTGANAGQATTATAASAGIAS